MSMWEIIKEQWATLPLSISPELCYGKTYIVTGSNIGLGLETAKLADTARRFPGSGPRLVFVSRALAFSVRADFGSIRDDGLNDRGKANMRNRYPLSKLVQIHIINWLARLYLPEKTGVVINMVNPGLCRTGLARYSAWYYQLYIDAIRVLLGARTAEAGSRTILYGVAAGEETHGKFLSGCEIKKDWVPHWIKDEDGKCAEDQIWKELVA